MTHTSERDDMQDGFVFRGEVLALDFVNTAIAVRGKAQELLREPADLDRWWAAAKTRYALGGADVPPASPASFAAAHELRAAQHRICTAVLQGQASAEEDLAMVNHTLAMAHSALTQDGSGSFRQTDALEPDGSTLLFQIARSTLRLLTEGDLRRLHTCRNERCVLLFYDTTKSGTRQWCSLDCFNRTRSSVRYRQRKTAAKDSETA